jgi:putative transposase
VRRELVEPENDRISVLRQCQLLGLNRTGLYYRGRTESAEDGELMRLIDEQYTRTPFYGYRRMTVYLQNLGFAVNHKRVRRLMRKLGLEAIYPKPNLSKPGKDHLTYPYLLKGVAIDYSDQVWATDITYIRIGSGFVYLLVIMDWHSRFVIELEVSNSLESSVFVETLKRALKKSQPEIFNSDQGSQFTAVEWLKVLQAYDIQISMDGRGRCFDNIFVERLWRTVKYEEVYLKGYLDVWETEESLRRYFEFYNYHRPHQSLNYRTPFEAYQKGQKTEENIRSKIGNFRSTDYTLKK